MVETASLKSMIAGLKTSETADPEKRFAQIGLDQKAQGSGSKGDHFVRSSSGSGLVTTVREPRAISASDADMAMMQACLTKDENGILAAIGAGANVNMQIGSLKRTPLHFAAMRKFERASEALKKAGADITLKDSSGKTAFEYAEKSHNKYIMQQTSG